MLRKLELVKLLQLIIIVFFISSIWKFYSFYVNQSEWQYADWLINYQGGFVRRGIIGEILFQIYKLIGIDLNKLVFLTVSVLYLFISIFLLKSIKFLKDKIDLLIFLSPGLFLYSIMNSEVVGRKDILLFFFMGFFVFFEKLHTDKKLLISLVITIFLLTLSHSGFLFYMPYLIFLFFLIKTKNGKQITQYEIFVIFLSLITIFFLIYLNQGSKEQVIEICNSIKYFVFDNCENRGQFRWLYTPVTEHVHVKIVHNFNIFVYLVSLLLVFFFLLLKLNFLNLLSNVKIIKKTKLIYIFIVLFILTFPIYILGYDWGRYISMSYFCSFFIYIYMLKNKLVKINQYNFTKNFLFKKKLFYIFLIIYTVGWTFPFYGAQNFKFPLMNPYIQVQKYLNKN